LESGGKVGIAPWNEHANRNILNTGKLTDLPHRFPVVIHHLAWRFSQMQYGYIYCEHVAYIETGLYGFERQERLHGCACRCHQHERSGDLNYREDP
jgi:hypothetical protein